MASLSIERGGLVVKTKYDADLVAALKRTIPAPERKFDPNQKAWIVNPIYSSQVAQLIQQYLGEMVFVPQVGTQKPIVETKILEMHYIGTTKEREGATERSAFGLDAAGEWSAIFPESTLRAWFCETDARPGEHANLYSVLGISNGADGDMIKAAYRRMARQWHPDMCKEPDAADQFRKIQEAYELLGDTNKRARYDVGLALEATLQRNYDRTELLAGYRAPLRCGMILSEGIEVIGRFMVNKILAWEDITDNRGRTLVSSWPMGATKPVEVWA